MRISRVKISNILGIEELTYDAGRINLVRGANGEGKSSFLSAITGALGSGSTAKLLRNGTDQGEIVLLLDDDIRFRAKVTEKGIVREAWDRDNVPIPRIQTWLKERLDFVAFNPVKFLRGTAEERLEWLLGIAPLHLTTSTLKAACPAAEILASSVDKEGEIKDPLKVLAALDTQMRERRTMVGREFKKKEGFTAELEKTLPAGTSEDCSVLLADARRLLTETQSARQIAEKRIDEIEAGEITAITKQLTDHENKLRKDAQDAIDRINTQLISDLAAARGDSDSKKEGIRQEAKEARKERLGILQEKETALSGDVARLEQVTEQQQKAETTRALLKQAQEEIREHKANYEALSKSIKAIDGIRAGLFAEMPISGLAVKDGAIFVDDVDYDTLNGANQVRVAFQLAKAASPGGIVCADGLMSELDNRHREHFEEWAEKSEIQLFITQVSDDGTPLTIEVKG